MFAHQLPLPLSATFCFWQDATSERYRTMHGVSVTNGGHECVPRSTYTATNASAAPGHSNSRECIVPPPTSTAVERGCHQCLEQHVSKHRYSTPDVVLLDPATPHGVAVQPSISVPPSRARLTPGVSLGRARVSLAARVCAEFKHGGHERRLLQRAAFQQQGPQLFFRHHAALHPACATVHLVGDGDKVLELLRRGVQLTQL